MFDIKQETFKEWDVPTPHTYPYDVFLDRNGELWSGSMSSDRVLRFDPQSGASIEYLLPRPTNIRRVFVDNTTNPGDVLGRQQSRRLHRQARAARLRWRASLIRLIEVQAAGRSRKGQISKFGGSQIGLLPR